MVKYSFFPCLLFVFFLQNPAVSHAHYSRTGQEIDENERRYFQLFPSINAVKSILLPSQNDVQSDSVKILLQRDSSANDTTISLLQETFQQLIFYINNFEQIYAGQKTVQWELLREIVRPYSPLIPQQPIDINITNNVTLSAFVLAVTDSAIICYTATDWTQWQTYSDSSITIVPFYLIETIQQRFIGKNFHLFSQALDFMKEYQIFLAMPPEVRTLYNKAIIQLKPPPQTLEIPEDILQQHFPPRQLHCTASVGLFTFFLEPTLFMLVTGKDPFGYDRFGFQVITPNIDRYAIYLLPSIDCSFSFLRQWHAAVSFTPLPSVEVSDTRNKRYAKKLDGSAFSLYCAYSLIQPNEFLDSPFEIQVGIGAALLNATITSTTPKNSMPEQTTTSTNSQHLLAPYVALKLDYFFSRALSLQCKTDFIPSGAIQENSIAPLLQGVPDSALVELKRIAISFGISVHL